MEKHGRRYLQHSAPPIPIPNHHQGRALARPFFSKDRISDFAIFERVSSTALNILSSRASHRQAIDVQDLLSRFTLDTASEFLFGVPLDTLKYPLTTPGRVTLGPKGAIPVEDQSEFDPFTEAFENVAVRITRRGAQGPAWPLRELFHDETEDSIDRIFEWINPLVEQALARKDEDRKAGIMRTEEDNVFLDFLASSTDGMFSPTSGYDCSLCGPSDAEHIRYELVTYLIASRDTVRQTT